MTDNTKHDHGEASCLDVIEHLYEYLDGDLNSDMSAKLEEHIAHCKSCYTRAEFEEALNKKMLKSGPKRVTQEVKIKISKLIDDI